MNNSDVSVSQTASALDANTLYRVRLVATKDFNAASVTSDEVTFTTDRAAAPVRLGAGSRTDTAAWLGAEVNPQNLPTSYFVEYTLASDAGYADSSRVPVAPQAVDIGDGNEFVTVSQLATGCSPKPTIVSVSSRPMRPVPPRGWTEGSPPVRPSLRRRQDGPMRRCPPWTSGGNIDRNLPVSQCSTSGRGSPAGRSRMGRCAVRAASREGLGGSVPQHPR